MSASRVMFIAAALACFGCAAAAADTVKPHGYATRDQLRECLDLQAALKVRFHARAQAGTVDDAEGDSLEAEGAKVHDAQGKLDRGDPAAVLAFKQAVADYNARVIAWKAATARGQAADDAYKTDSAVVDQECVGLSYRTQDVDAVMKERKKLAGATAN